MTEALPKGYLTPLRVESCGPKDWILLEDFCWRGSKNDVFTVYKGETTDFASVPWWTQSLLPRTGTWTKAAVVHDKMCNELNEYYRLKKQYDAALKHWELNGGWEPHNLVMPTLPLFDSVDTDFIFRKNAIDEGTGKIRAELLWFGVRCGAMSRPRRGGWSETAPRWFFDLICILITLFVLGAVISVIWPW